MNSFTAQSEYNYGSEIFIQSQLKLTGQKKVEMVNVMVMFVPRMVNYRKDGILRKRKYERKQKWHRSYSPLIFFS